MSVLAEETGRLDIQSKGGPSSCSTLSQSSDSVGQLTKDLDFITTYHTPLLNPVQVSCSLSMPGSYLSCKMPFVLFPINEVSHSKSFSITSFTLILQKRLS